MRQIGIKQLENIAKGATLLSSGGGGPIGLAKKWINDLDHFEASIIDPSEIDHSKYVVVIAYMGSPESALMQSEKDESAVAAFLEMKQWLKSYHNAEIGALVPIEVGGVNSIVPLLVANEVGLPVVDLDGAGRAVPTLTCTTFAGAKFSAVPSILATAVAENSPKSPLKNKSSVLLQVNQEGDITDTELVESLARPILTTTTFNSIGALSIWCIPGKELLSSQNAFVPNTLTLAEKIGQHLVFPDETCSDNNSLDNVKTILDKANIRYKIFAVGPLKSYESTSEGGFDIAQAIFETEQGDVIIKVKNESLIAWSANSTSPLVIAPDSICYLGCDGAPYSNADLKTVELQVQCGILSVKHQELILSCEICNRLKFNLIAIQVSEQLQAWQSVKGKFAEILNHQLGYPGPYHTFE